LTPDGKEPKLKGHIAWHLFCQKMAAGGCQGMFALTGLVNAMEEFPGLTRGRGVSLAYILVPEL
jgi:hypothetical protein